MIIDKLKILINKHKNRKEAKKMVNRELKNAYKRKWRIEHPEESKRLDKKYKENRKKKKNKKEENKEMYSLGIWSKDEKETLMLLKVQYGREYEEIRKILNETYGNNRTIGAVRTRLSILTNKQRKEVDKMPIGVYERKPKDEGKENILHTAIEFLEKKKEGKSKKEIKMITEWQDKTSTLGKVIENGFNEMFKNRNKPIRKVWYLAIKAKEEDVNKYEKRFNELMEEWKTSFPEAKITLSICGKDK